MGVYFDTDTDTFVIASETCPCGADLYQSGCDAPGCNGLGCQDCGAGCDRDFVEDGNCATAAAEESDEEHEERINQERAAFGLPPITAQCDSPGDMEAWERTAATPDGAA